MRRDNHPARRNAVLMVGLFAIVFAMVGASFAAVPLYDLFCRVTGYGGTTQVGDSVADEVLDRTVRVRFTADIDRDLPWRFEPEQRETEIRVGEPALVYYRVENLSDRPVAATAVYNVNPAKTGAYFVKVQCFCFDQQVLQPGEAADLPVYFYVDPAMDADRDLDDVKTITLSYTFFRATSEELDGAEEDRYTAVDAAPDRVAGAAGSTPPEAAATVR